MTDPPRFGPEIEALIARVLRASELDFIEGRNEVERDLRAHFEDGLRAGLSEEELVKRFGDPVQAGRHIAGSRPAAERRRRGETGGMRMMWTEGTVEFRRALGRLMRSPAYATTVVLTLALGVGANTAIFTVLNAVLLEEPPYHEPDRLVRLYEGWRTAPERQNFVKAPMFLAWREWDEVFSDAATLYTYRETGADLTSDGQTRRVVVTSVSADYFETLGVAPVLGRVFREDESYGPGEYGGREQPGSTVILSHRLWQEQFGEDDPIGRTIDLNGRSAEVVGVMPAGFDNPFGSPADLWRPHDLRLGGSNSWGNSYLSVVARLRDGVAVEAARERLTVLMDGLRSEVPEVGDEQSVKLVPLQADVVGDTRARMLFILAAAAGLVLLTACLNVANLLFARGLGQDRDFALRSALGAGRSRLVTQVFAESGVLALVGGGLGLLLGWAGVTALLSIAPDALPNMASVELSTEVFLFAFAVTGAALLFFGSAPAWRMSRTAPAEVLRAGDRSATVGRFIRRVRDSLVMVQVAVALVLVTGAALLARSFVELTDVPLGVEPEGVLTFEVHLPGTRYPDGESRDAFHRESQGRIAGLSGVEAVGATSWLPVNGRYHIWGFSWEHPEGLGSSSDGSWHGTDTRVIAGDYFAANGIDVVRGASPAEVDLGGEYVMWVNETVARDVFVDVDPVGERVYQSGELRRIVGVIEDIPHSPRGDVSRKVYLPHTQFADNRNWSLIQTVRATGDLAEVRDRIRGELAAMDGQLVLYRPRTLEGHLDTVRAQDRFATVLMGAFALLALTLSLVGTYGVLAGSVAGRTREFGIRMALGADGERVRGMVLRYAAVLTVPGVLLGVGVAWIGSRWIETLLFRVNATDPLAYAAAATTFVFVGALAALIPARRATRVDTIRALSSD